MEKFFYFRSESISWKICSFNFRNYNFSFSELPLHVAGENKLKSETRLLYRERKMRGVLVYFLRLIACILCDAGKSSLFCVPIHCIAQWNCLVYGLSVLHSCLEHEPVILLCALVLCVRCISSKFLLRRVLSMSSNKWEFEFRIRIDAGETIIFIFWGSKGWRKILGPMDSKWN